MPKEEYTAAEFIQKCKQSVLLHTSLLQADPGCAFTAAISGLRTSTISKSILLAWVRTNEAFHNLAAFVHPYGNTSSALTSAVNKELMLTSGTVRSWHFCPVCPSTNTVLVSFESGVNKARSASV